MTPQTALNAQIEKYRAMTGEERLKLALDLHELSCEIARDGIRYQHPKAGADKVERLLRARIALAQSL
jgi:Rv0078B-related antitoxin